MSEPRDAADNGDEMEELRRERDAALEAQDRFAFLARSGRYLAQSIDYEETLKTVASLALPYLGAWGVVDIMEDGHLRRLAVIHPNPEKQEVARELCRRYPRRMAELLGVYRVLESGEPEVVNHVDPEQLESMAKDDDHRGLLEKLGIGAYMTVPLAARGEVHGTMSFVIRENGRRIGPPDLLLAEDLAHRAGLAIDNARLYRKSEEANRAKADFLAVISHELRTPLTAILGFTELLATEIDGPITDGQRNRLHRIEHSTKHMAQLVEELISYAQLEAGGETVRAEEMDVREALDDALQAVRAEADEKGLELRPETAVAGTFRTDPRIFRQILANLLTNAVKYTNEGYVSLQARRRDGALEVEIEDSGIGISEDDQRNIFEAFWQAEHPNTRTYGGTGIGLSLTRRLVATLDGEVEVESTFGEGSRFTVRLPPMTLPDR